MLVVNQSVVWRLRVRAPRRDRLATRLRLENLLGTLCWQPTGLAPSAILCVRQLRDRRPRLLRLDPGAVHAPADWATALHADLEQLVRHAARPAAGTVSATENAVLFADRAELLACLVRDWMSGCAATAWWWKALFGARDLTGTVLPLLLTEPAYLPAVFQQLADKGLAVAFARTLGPDSAIEMLNCLSQTFHLADFSTFSHFADDNRREAFVRFHETGISREFVSWLPLGRTAKTAERPAPPWLWHVPEIDGAGLRAPQQAVLGVTLLLHRAPAVARAHEFAATMARWWRAHLQSQATEDPPLAALPGAATSQEMASPHEGTRMRPGPPPPASAALESGAGDPQSTNPEVLKTRLAVGQPRSSIDSVDGAPVNPTHLLVASQGEPQPAESEREAGAPPPQSMTRTDGLVETELGGLFYLINLGLFLELYGDFAKPAAPGLDLPIWDFVVLLGEQLLGVSQRPADPVWPLLAKLAGRGVNEAPGRDFAPPDDWRVPAHWMAPFSPAGVWRWNADDGRLRLEHPQGFVVLDVPLAEPVAGAADLLPGRHQAEEEMRGCANGADVRLDQATPVDHFQKATRLGCWLGRLMPYVRRRLRRALGVANENDIPRLLCERAAQVFVTSTHVDVVFKLADLPIEIRLSGLDRDPGWLPAAGKFIRFHFH